MGTEFRLYVEVDAEMNVNTQGCNKHGDLLNFVTYFCQRCKHYENSIRFVYYWFEVRTMNEYWRYRHSVLQLPADTVPRSFQGSEMARLTLYYVSK